MFGLILTYSNFTISDIIGLWQTELFFDHVLEYFEEYNKHTIKGAMITQLINEFEDSRDVLFNKSRNNNDLFLLFGISASIMFFFIYKISKRLARLDDHTSYFNLRDELKYPLFISLFFSVGLAFYFSTSSTESSMIETTSTILSTIQPFTDTRTPLTTDDVKTILEETFVSKLSLISMLFADKTTEFYNSSFSQTYFFCIVGFLVTGVLLNKAKKLFLADALFISSLVGTVFWMLYMALKVIPNLRIF